MYKSKLLGAAHQASLSLIITTVLLVTVPVYAATVNFHPSIPNMAVSIDNLEFGGQLWTISFVNDTFDNLTANNTDTSLFPTFGSEANSIALNDAINVELNSAGAIWVGDISGSDVYAVPWEVFLQGGTDPTNRHRASYYDQIVPNVWATNTINQQVSNSSVYTYSTASPVPSPGAVWLLGSGMLGLLGILTRRKAT
jgi:hypothetical protein